MDKVLVAGNVGFIGFFLVKKLLEKGNKVYIIDDENKVERYKDEPNVNICKNFKSIDKNIKKVYYIQDNEIYSTKQVSTYGRLKTNITFTQKLLSKISEFNCEKILFTSTCNIYHNANHLRKFRALANEDSILAISDISNPESSYVLSKLMCENLILSYCKQNEIHYNIARLGNIYGEGMSKENIIYRYIQKALTYKRSMKLDNPEIRSTYLYVEDAAQDIITLMEGYPDGIFNIASKERIKLLDIVYLLEILTKEDFNKTYISQKKKLPPKFYPDISKFEYYFGDQDHLQFALGLKKTFKWYKKGEFNKDGQ